MGGNKNRGIRSILTLWIGLWFLYAPLELSRLMVLPKPFRVELQPPMWEWIMIWGGFAGGIFIIWKLTQNL